MLANDIKTGKALLTRRYKREKALYSFSAETDTIIPVCHPDMFGFRVVCFDFFAMLNTEQPGQTHLNSIILRLGFVC